MPKASGRSSLSRSVKLTLNDAGTADSSTPFALLPGAMRIASLTGSVGQSDFDNKKGRPKEGRLSNPPNNGQTQRKIIIIPIPASAP